MRIMEQEIYDGMWSSFRSATERGQYDLDFHILNRESDSRRGITVLTYLNQSNSDVVDEIINFQQAIKAIEPQQYFYPANELHLTILSVITCVPEFTLSEINVASYGEIFESVMSGADPIEIKYRGVSASSSCLVIQGFAVGNGLESLRNILRKEFIASGLRSSFNARYKLVTAHCTAIRFCRPLNNGNQLFQLCEQYRHHDFGSIVYKECELVFNNWYQNLSLTQSLMRHRLPV